MEDFIDDLGGKKCAICGKPILLNGEVCLGHMTEEERFNERADREYEKQRDERAWIRKLIDDGKVTSATAIVSLMNKESAKRKAEMINYLKTKLDEKAMGL